MCALYLLFVYWVIRKGERKDMRIRNERNETHLDPSNVYLVSLDHIAPSVDGNLLYQGNGSTLHESR